MDCELPDGCYVSGNRIMFDCKIQDKDGNWVPTISCEIIFNINKQEKV
jgi:hypothetical protein